ncbi:MAG: hypothetical protein K2G37_02105 [Clostridia bacterium]|nr:hypothetical protein [Clostridia bacterium]MDE7328873.1 hypothetical protein [Clostridia bacterium]
MATRKDERPAAGRKAPAAKNATSRSAASSKSKTTTVHYNKTEGKKMSRKEKKIEKKLAKFNERDLRSYPMTVGKWIGTYILLAIPLVNVICCICWFFGAGNKSRAAWIRSHVVRFLIIILLIVAIIGSGWLVLKNQASKNAGAETPQEIAFYGVEQIADLIGGIAGEETADMIKAMFAEMLGIPYESENGGENGGGNGDENVFEGNLGDEGDQGYEWN